MSDIADLASTADEAYAWSPADFSGRVPFPHAVIDGFWPDQLLRDVAAEFPPPADDRWRTYATDQERKQEGASHLWGEATTMLMGVLAEQPMVARIERLLGITGLHAEPVGGGMHQIPPGGRLGVHTDFNGSPRTGARRVANLLIFLNEGWLPEWGGALELWGADRPVRKIVPIFNRMVIFATSDRSWHGHPTPTMPPDDRCRRSIATYYFTDAPLDGDLHSTLWRDDSP